MQLHEHDAKVDFDICYFKGKLARARADGDMELVARLEKQIDLLEDCVVLYRITRAPERRVFYFDSNQPDNK